ncbi:MAG: hypothetical protein M0Q42_13655 [Xanthomonadales bacterium]|nr:hypothetical protein [Xanthomonadales bacterium]
MEITGGNCIDCPYQPPEATGSRGEFRLTVLQHNLISYTLDDGETYRMQPLVWGTPMVTVFPEIADHSLPLLSTQEPALWAPGSSAWLLIIRAPEDSSTDYLTSFVIFWVESGQHSYRPIFSMLFISYYPYSPEMAVPITMECARPSEERAHGTVPQEILETLGPDPVCIVSRYIGIGLFQHYIAPLADVGDGYFFATAQDGSSIEGHRLLYR